ncbi:MAG: hypothetical protein LUQ67_04870 [Methanomicrobiales archaeon]|nr:hypothetical protein [Methanomicrobiales archaeon]
MKSHSVILLCFIGLLCLVQAGSALAGTNIQTSPPQAQLNALQPGDVVSEVSGTITVPTSGGMTFEPDDSVEFYTQLDDAKWSISIVVGGIENPARTYGGKHATIGGYDLSYPTSGYQSVALKFSMTEGKVPSSFTSGTITLVRVVELDEDSRQVGAAVNVNGTVINKEALQTQLGNVKAKLADLKSQIDEKAAANIDVSAAQAKYNAAETAIESADIKISTSPSEVSGLLATATTNIDQAGAALEKADADYSLQQAKAMLASVDGLITEFTVNDSLKQTDARLVPIITKRDLAAQAISSANDLFTTGSFSSAQAKANDGLSLANQAWNLSLSLKTELGQGFQLPDLSAFLPVLIVIVVVGIIAGVVIYRKKMHWDELG